MVEHIAQTYNVLASFQSHILVLGCKEKKGQIDFHESTTSIKTCLKRPGSNNYALHSGKCFIKTIAMISGELFSSDRNNHFFLKEETEFYLGDYRLIMIAMIYELFSPSKKVHGLPDTTNGEHHTLSVPLPPCTAPVSTLP